MAGYVRGNQKDTARKTMSIFILHSDVITACDRHEPYCWDEARRVLLRAKMDAWFARGYALRCENLRYIHVSEDVHGAESADKPSAFS